MVLSKSNPISVQVAEGIFLASAFLLLLVSLLLSHYPHISPRLVPFFDLNIAIVVLGYWTFSFRSYCLFCGFALQALDTSQEQPARRHKLAIALKEANETDYWLALLHRTHYLSDEIFRVLKKKNLELIKLLIRIIKTSKERLNK